MDRLYKYLLDMLSKYFKTDNINKKMLYANDIALIYIALYDDLHKIDDFIEINEVIFSEKLIVNKMKKFLHMTSDIDVLEQLIENQNQLEQFITSDLNYIRYLLNNIKIPNISRSTNNIKNDNFKIFKNYIKTNEELYAFYLDNVNNYFYDSNFSLSIAIHMKSSNKDLIILNNKNSVEFIHEFMHSYYTNNSKKIYIEVPSIVAEIALISKYNLSYQNYRIKELIRNKNHLNNENIDYKMLIDISYSLGMLISIPFIYKYGNDLNIILDAINNIIENDNKNFSLILNELDINDNDIMDSFKNINKILKI